jgi:hypothetical protein
MNIVRYLALYETIPRCDKFTANLTIVRGTFDAAGPGYESQQPPQTPYTLNNGFMTTGTRDYTAVFPIDDQQYVRVAHALSDHTEGPITGSLIINSVTLEGEGTDPFAGRETS